MMSFVDNVSSDGKEIILLGDFNKNLLNENKDIEWENFVTSLGLNIYNVNEVCSYFI